MKSSTSARAFRVAPNGERQVLPETRRGTAAVHPKTVANHAMYAVLAEMESDVHYGAIAKRIEKFTEKTHLDLSLLNAAIEAGDTNAIAETARRLTDHTGRMGAMKMMRLAIALQMVARREMLDQAKDIAADLDLEFLSLKDTYIGE